ncbi:uncharacterized protein [Neodiprion pinetum]|uniref:uncharacterized protein isoform X2 n=1 Tax=Neodiprion pinetum TaxID=441929 RepID=UPI001EDEB971|nr:uncharacterized protein LOC124211976 isoform X2 [Neodiprion pinetum]
MHVYDAGCIGDSLGRLGYYLAQALQQFQKLRIMSDITADEETVSSASQESLEIDTNRQFRMELSCPFTWDMEDTIKSRIKLLDTIEYRLETVTDIQDDFPEFVVIYHLLLVYENTLNDELSAATQCIMDAEKCLTDIKEKKTLVNVENVLQHILIGTKYHVLKKLEQLKEANDLLKRICPIDGMNNVELAMLNGCKCLAWSLYNATDKLKAITYAQKAIEYETDNGKWYFLLGKNYRRLRRRDNSLANRPNQQEAKAFETAYKFSKRVLFGVSLAQMYRESGNYDEANKIYEQIYALKPNCTKVQLQLALGFIRMKKCRLAKNCLDFVAEKMPNSPAYAHYMGIYEEKCNRNFETALPYYTAAIQGTNFAAECQYMKCKKIVEGDWDPLPYMLELLNKYAQDSDHVKQQINITIGSYYLFEMQDILNACQYITNAIKIKPNAKALREHFDLFRGYRVNIYHVLAKEIAFVKQTKSTIFSDDEMEILNDTVQLCNRNCKDLPSISTSELHTSSQPSAKSFHDYHRGSVNAKGNNRSERGRTNRGSAPNVTPRWPARDTQNYARGFHQGSVNAEGITRRGRTSNRGSIPNHILRNVDNTQGRAQGCGRTSRELQSNRGSCKESHSLSASRNTGGSGFTNREQGVQKMRSASHNVSLSDNDGEAMVSCSLVRTFKNLDMQK